MARVCVFDVNETLLDLSALDAMFERVFGTPAARQAWFQQVLHSAFVATITGAYADFGAIGAAALTMVAQRQSVRLSPEQSQSILGGMRTLPAHPDVRDGLDLLRAAGVRLAALTNSPPATARAQLDFAGLTPYFEQILSADDVRRLKPAPEPYFMAADRLGVRPAQVRLVAAHAWDVAGAQRAGCAAAFVARPNQVLDPLVAVPDVVGDDLREVARLILEREQKRVS